MLSVTDNSPGRAVISSIWGTICRIGSIIANFFLKTAD